MLQQPGYTYSVSACDNSSSGAGPATFSIQVINTLGLVVYQNGGAMTSGDIVILSK